MRLHILERNSVPYCRSAKIGGLVRQSTIQALVDMIERRNVRPLQIAPELSSKT
jgi:hypothetical protein